ncbi:flagellin [Amaricoccus sp.]|uniref:flagellin N-terminal helical domain-containing protein n=1 Tax=Amaricoccus sp. TaxID=1872485 RepID=UPI001B628894|nr:flagellin [Amaricoccus sp.]MBP7240718.1 flagellin [Amaricoccus sp.]
MSSILTNSSSLVALQTLKSINSNLGKVQNEISTGLKIATAKDNSSTWAIAATMTSDVGAYKKMSESLTAASETIGVARNAAEQMVDTLKLVQAKVVEAKKPGADLAKLQADVDTYTATMQSIGASAQVNGINMVDNTTTQNFTVSLTRASAGSVGLEVLAVDGVDLVTDAAADVTLVADATDESDLDAVETQLQAAIDAAAAFGAAQARIDAQNSFLGKQMDAIKNASGAMIDADMEEASARLTALQTQQQLGIQSLSIANQAPQSILSLFR